MRPSQLTGAVLGDRYKINGYLSRGTAARVYLAEDRESGGSVVLRMLSADGAKDAELRARIDAETARAEPVRHPNLVDLLGVGETATGLPYLVMEALSGERLDELLRRGERLPTDLALVIARQAAAGLIALHKAGLVHGDVSARSLMVLGAPEEPYGVKLLDYGLARLWREPRPADDPWKSPTGDIESARDSVAYLSPEQILCEPADPRSDVFGLGVVLFQMLLGHLPFEASLGHPLRHQLFSPIPQANWLETGLDPKLEAVILNATRKRRENRYESMEALLEHLDAVVGLSTLSVEINPLDRTPDIYEPQSDGARARLAELSQKYPSLPPGSGSTAVS